MSHHFNTDETAIKMPSHNKGYNSFISLTNVQDCLNIFSHLPLICPQHKTYISNTHYSTFSTLDQHLDRLKPNQIYSLSYREKGHLPKWGWFSLSNNHWPTKIVSKFLFKIKVSHRFSNHWRKSWCTIRKEGTHPSSARTGSCLLICF